MEDARNRPFMLLLIAILVAILAWALNLKNVPDIIAGTIPRVETTHPLQAGMNRRISKKQQNRVEERFQMFQGFEEQAGVRTDASLAVNFTSKTVCRTNIMLINRAVEQWHALESQWPKDDLSDIGRDRNYFPNGIPRCPLDDAQPYSLDPDTHRIIGHTHPEIPDITNPRDFFGQ